MAAAGTRSTGTDLLVRVWRELAAGNEDKARETLVMVWKGYMDAVASEQGGRVALRLFDRLKPCTDAPDAWSRLPPRIVVYRAGPPGPSWSTDRDTVEHLLKLGFTPMRVGTVARDDVLGYIEGRGEFEIIVPFERVTERQVVARKEHPPPTASGQP